MCSISELISLVLKDNLIWAKGSVAVFYYMKTLVNFPTWVADDKAGPKFLHLAYTDTYKIPLNVTGWAWSQSNHTLGEYILMLPLAAGFDSFH